MERRNRKENRVHLQQPLKAILSIHQYEGKSVPEKISFIRIKNISSAGIGIESTLQFPIEEKLILCIRTIILGKKFTLYGSIMWKKKTGDNLFEYGLKLTTFELSYIRLMEMLNSKKMIGRSTLPVQKPI